jgi:hypothetical protein
VKETAENLIKLCKQAPYGRNFDTVVDISVRDSFELDPACIQINNVDWNKGLEKLLERVASGLGIEEKIQAIMYKLLVYRPGIANLSLFYLTKLH